jgi:signal transduction histidine kinase/ABC-type amino acid transport substrate-binding protein
LKHINRIILIILIFIIPKPLLAYGEDIIIIGGDRNYPPYEYIDENGDYRGFNVDIMRALAIELGIDIRFKPMDWKSAIKALENGEIDAIQGMSYNEDRAKKYEFSEKHLENSLIYFVPKEASFIFELSDLKGKKVAVQRNDLAENVLSQVDNVDVVMLLDLEEALDKLVNKEVDVVLGSKLVGTYIIRKKDLSDEIKMVGYEFNQTPYSIAFKKGNDQLKNKFDKALKQLKEDGIYQKIYEKWFGQEEEVNLQNFKYAIYILFIIIIVILMISLFIYKINKKLKKEVDKRTEELNFKNKQLGEKNRIIEQNYRFKKQILDNLGIGLITFNKDGIITTINNDCEELIEIGQELIGKGYYKERLDGFFDIDKIQSCIEDGKKYRYIEKTFVRNNEQFTFAYTLWPLYGDNNNHIGGVLTFRDITDVILYEKKLNQKDKMESLGRLVSGIAHEIRNPLTAIKTYIELLPIKYDNERFRDKIVNQVPKEIDRLNNLLSELLDYSKPKKIEKEMIRFKELIDGIKELFISELDRKDIKLSCNIEDVNIYGDKQQIKQILINLLINSVEAIEKEGNINLTVKEEKGSVLVIIEDNGEGIEEKDLKSIFDPFYTTKPTGTGLGLFICYKYIKENKGEIKIESKKGKGTKIYIIFKKGDK